MKPFDYIVVGAGLFGATFAHEAATRGYKVKVIEKRNHIAGNIYTNLIAIPILQLPTSTEKSTTCPLT